VFGGQELQSPNEETVSTRDYSYLGINEETFPGPDNKRTAT